MTAPAVTPTPSRPLPDPGPAPGPPEEAGETGLRLVRRIAVGFLFILCAAAFTALVYGSRK